jgi:hypothetical protein
VRVYDPTAARNVPNYLSIDDVGAARDDLGDDAASRVAPQVLEPRKLRLQSGPQIPKLQSTPEERRKSFCARCS